MVWVKGTLFGLLESDVQMRPQDALEPWLSGLIAAELSLDCDILELKFHAGPFLSADKNNTSEEYLWRSMTDWD